MKRLLSAVLVAVMIFALAAGTFVSATASVAIESLDNIYVNDAQLFNGGADTWLAANEIKGKIQTIGIRGWMIMGNGDIPSSFGYRIDDGDPVKVDGSVVYDQSILDATGNAYPNMRRDVFTADVSEVGLGEHTFTIAVWNEADEVAYGKSFAFTQELTPGEDPGPTPPALKANNIDAWNFWKDGTLTGTPTTFAPGEYTGFHIAGWFGFNYEVLSVGYRINGIETFVDGTLRTAEQAVKDLAGEYAVRYEMDGSFVDLSFGTNDFDIIVKLNDSAQSVIDLFSNIPVQVMLGTDDAVWFYVSSSFTTGYWTGPNCGYPDSDIQIAFQTPESFDGVYLYAYASPAPSAAVMDINLYDEYGNLLETVTQTFNGDGYTSIEFSNVYPAGEYTLQFVFVEGGHFVLASGTPTGIVEYGVSGTCNIQYPDSAPAVALLKADLPVRDPSVSTGYAALDEFKYDGVDVGSGSLYKWINNPDNREEIDFELGAVSEIYFRGWAQFTNPVTGFGYIVDDGEVVTDPSFVQDRTAELEGAGFYNAQGYIVTVPVADLAAGEHTIKIVAIDEYGYAVEIFKTKNEIDYPIALTFTVSEAATTAALVNMSFNTVWVDGVQACDIGDALAFLESEPISGNISSIGLRGWAWIENSTIESFGYRIDGGEPIFSTDYIQQRDDLQMVLGVSADVANGFNVNPIDVSGLADGYHTVTVVVLAADGTSIDLVTVPFIVGENIVVDANIDLYQVGSGASTGWWTGPIVTGTYGMFDVKFTTPNAFNGIRFLMFTNGATYDVSVINEFGSVVETVRHYQANDNASETVNFCRGYAPGTYTIRFALVEGNYMVLGSANAGDIAVTVTYYDAVTNDNTLAAPLMTLLGTVNPGMPEAPNCLNAAFDELKYDETVLCSYRAYMWVADPENGEVLDFTQDDVSQILFRGWAQLDKPILGFGYVIDDGLIVTDTSFIQDRAAELEGAGFPGGQGYAVTVPTDNLTPGNHTIRIVAIDEDYCTVELFKAKNGVDYPFAITFMVFAGADPAQIRGYSLDTAWVDGIIICNNGNVLEYVANNPISGDIGTIGFRGWAWIENSTIESFGYRVDGGEPIFSTDYIQQRPDIQAALGLSSEVANGFCINPIDVSGLADGNHTVTVVVLAADGTYLDVVTVPFMIAGSVLPSPEDAVYFYDPASYTTGYWIGPNCGFPNGSDIQISFITPDPFDGVFLYAYTSYAPSTAVVDINLYDRYGDLLETVTQTFDGDGYATVYFNNAYRAGAYTLQFAFVEGGHFVLASGTPTGVECSVSGECNIQYSDAAPAIALLKAEGFTIPAKLFNMSFNTVWVDGNQICDIGDALAFLESEPISGNISSIGLRGWAHIDFSTIEAFGYSIDGGEPIFSTDYIQQRPDVQAAFGVSADVANGFCINPIDVSGVEVGEHNVTVVVLAADGTYVDVVTVPFEIAPYSPISAKSFDWYAVDGLLVSVSGNVDKLVKQNTAYIKNDRNDIGFYGFAALKEDDTISGFGYSIDGAEIVVDEGFFSRISLGESFDRTEELTAAGFPNGEGFWITLDYTDIECGTHTLTLYVFASDGTPYEMTSYEFSVYNEDDIAWLYDRSASISDGKPYTTGYWIGPNVSYTYGFIDVHVEATEGFDGIYTSYYANGTPGSDVYVYLFNSNYDYLDHAVMRFVDNSSKETKFSRAYPAGEYIIRYEYAYNGISGHFVLGSGYESDVYAYVDGYCAANEDTLSAPSIGLIKAECEATKVLQVAFDQLRYDDNYLVDNGRAYSWVADPENREAIDYDLGTVSEITFRGWVQLNREIYDFGYIIDGELSGDRGFTEYRPDVEAAGFPGGVGYNLTVPVSRLGEGEHTIQLVAFDEYGAVIELYKLKNDVYYPIGLTFTVSINILPKTARYSIDRIYVNENCLNYGEDLTGNDTIYIDRYDSLYILGWAISDVIGLDRIVYTVNGGENIECWGGYMDRSDVASAFGYSQELGVGAGFGEPYNMLELSGIRDLPDGTYNIEIKAIFRDGDEIVLDRNGVFTLVVGTGVEDTRPMYSLDRLFVNESNRYNGDAMYGSNTPTSDTVYIEQGDKIYILGWAINTHGLDRIVYTINGGDNIELPDCYRDRPDVAAAFGYDYYLGNRAGFGFDEDMMELTGIDTLRDGTYYIEIKAIFNDGTELVFDQYYSLGVFTLVVGDGIEKEERVTDTIDDSKLNIVIDGGLGLNETSPGSEIDVKIRLVNNEAISSLKIKLLFDSRLTVVTDERGIPMVTFDIYDPEDTSAIKMSILRKEDNTLLLNWVSNESEVYGDVVYATIRFRVADDVRYGAYLPIRAVVNPDFVFDSELNNIDYKLINGYVDINAFMGDVNSDRKLNNKDVVLLFRYVSDQPGIEINTNAADYNCDGEINNKDVVTLFRYVSST